MSPSSSPQPVFFWTLPTVDDGRGRASRDPAVRSRISAAFHDARRGRFDFYDYLFQVARATQAAGFNGIYVPWDDRGEDPWIATAALARRIDQLTFLPELQPGFSTPVYFAKLAASFERFAGPRLAYQLDLGRDSRVRRAHGELLDGTDFLERAAEFVVAARGVATRQPFDFEGHYFGIEAGGLNAPLARPASLPLYTSGHSPAVIEFAAVYSNVHLFDSSPELPTHLELLHGATQRHGRPLDVGVRARLVARASEDEAARDAEWLGLASDAWVGSYDKLAQRIEDLVARGVSQFVFDATPRLEEAYRFGEQLFPRLSMQARPRPRAA